MSADGFEVLLTLLAKAVTVIAALYAGWRWGLPRFKQWHASRREMRAALMQLPQVVRTVGHLNALDQGLTSILYELKPNGGGSLRDTIERISDRTIALQREHALLVEEVRAHMDRDDACAVFVADAQGQQTWASRSYLRWVNRSREEVLGRGWINTVYPDDRERVRDEWASAIAEQREFVLRYRMQDSRGGMFPVQMDVTALRGSSAPGISAFHGVIRRVDH